MNDFAIGPRVEVGQIYTHPTRNYVIITAVRHGHAAFSYFAANGVVNRGQMDCDNLVREFGVPSIDDIISMDVDIADALRNECPEGTRITQGYIYLDSDEVDEDIDE